MNDQPATDPSRTIGYVPTARSETVPPRDTPAPDRPPASPTVSLQTNNLPAEVEETLIPGYEMLNWLGLFAPAGTPRAIVERLAAESLKVVRTPEVVQRFHAQGAEPSPLGTAEFAAFLKSELAKWAKVVAATGMTVE